MDVANTIKRIEIMKLAARNHIDNEQLDLIKELVLAFEELDCAFRVKSILGVEVAGGDNGKKEEGRSETGENAADSEAQG